MNAFLLGKKLGMTQLFHSDGTAMPVTILSAGPCTITHVKTEDKDGYSAIQIGFLDSKQLNKPRLGHQKKTGTKLKHLKEFAAGAEATLKVGDTVDVGQFGHVKHVSIASVSKGKGFAGVIKRHGFSRGPVSHGSDHHRAPGSIGSMFPQRVLKGKKMPGHLGTQRVSQKKLEVVSIDKQHHLLVVRGSVPGPKNALVEIAGSV